MCLHHDILLTRDVIIRSTKQKDTKQFFLINAN